MSKKLNRHAYADRLRYMHMIEDGYSIGYISDHYGINNALLSLLWQGYQKEGPLALKKKSNVKASLEIRLKAIQDFEEKHLSA